MIETEYLCESRIVVALSLPLLAIGSFVAWRFVETDTTLEAALRLGLLAGLAGVALDYGRRLLVPVLRVNADGFSGNPIWSNKRGAKMSDLRRYEIRRQLRLTTLLVFDHSGSVIYRIWLRPDPENVRAAVRFLPQGTRSEDET